MFAPLSKQLSAVCKCVSSTNPQHSLFCFPQAISARKINNFTSAQKGAAMTNAERDGNNKATHDCFVHNLADVQTTSIGKNTKIWQFCVVLEGAKIGSNVNVCSHCFIENNVTIGNNVTVKNGVYLFDGITLEDDVFIGPNVTFTNDKYPRSKIFSTALLKTLIKNGASVGGGAVILPGITIGEHAMIGAGAIVTKDVPPNAVVYGNAATIKSMLPT
jgi:acetyltransferase-like isoleucine patch superfamily enzyme